MPPTALELNTRDWATLDQLRRRFLDGTAGQQDYWQSERELALYDLTFGQRIAWKWQHVLRELQRLEWHPPQTDLCDWGCGTGIAARQVLATFKSPDTRQVRFWDRSPLARQFACTRTRQDFPGLSLTTGAPRHGDILLISHVLGELDDTGWNTLLAAANQAACILWVEPGTHADSRRLITARELLRSRFTPVAPCTHSQPCGLLAPGLEHHWCHHFATSPPIAYTERLWTRFSHMTGIDLRSLPLSYLVLDRRPQPDRPRDLMRIIGQPRTYKAFARLFGCDSHGTREREVHRRHLPEAFRLLKKQRLDTLQHWQHDDRQVTALSPGTARPT